MKAPHPSGALSSWATEHSDDSPFVSAADFFSLISLTLIYALIAVGERGEGLASSAQEVQIATVARITARDPYAAYVTVSSAEKNLLVTVVPSQADNRAVREITSNNRDVLGVKSWVMETIAEGASPAQVIFYMSEEEQDPEAHKLFNQLLSVVRREYPVIQAFRNGVAP